MYFENTVVMVIITIDYSVHEEYSSCSRNVTRCPDLLDLYVMLFYMFNAEKTKATKAPVIS